LPVLIDHLLNVGQKVRGVLDFVKNYWWGMQRQKAAGVCRGRGANIGRFQGDIAV
jgi:hypothetical protein